MNLCQRHQAWMEKEEIHHLLHQTYLFQAKSQKKWIVYGNKRQSKAGREKGRVTTKQGWGSWAGKNWSALAQLLENTQESRTCSPSDNSNGKKKYKLCYQDHV